MLAVRLLVLTCCAALCLTNGDPWSWNCQPVKEQQIVNVDKLLGRWHYVEWIVPGKIRHEHFCRVLNISRTENGSVLLFQYEDIVPNEGHKRIVITTNIISPSKWMATGTPHAVVDQSQDGLTLAISYCNPIQNTAVFSRGSRVNLTSLHDRLKSAGVVGVDHAEAFDRTGCPADHNGAICWPKGSSVYGLLLFLLLSRLL